MRFLVYMLPGLFATWWLICHKVINPIIEDSLLRILASEIPSRFIPELTTGEKGFTLELIPIALTVGVFPIVSIFIWAVENRHVQTFKFYGGVVTFFLVTFRLLPLCLAMMSFSASVVACFCGAFALVLIIEAVASWVEPAEEHWLAALGCVIAPIILVLWILLVGALQVPVLAHLIFACVLIYLAGFDFEYPEGRWQQSRFGYLYSFSPLVLCVAWYAFGKHGGNPFEGIVSAAADNPFYSPMTVCCVLAWIPLGYYLLTSGVLKNRREPSRSAYLPEFLCCGAVLAAILISLPVEEFPAGLPLSLIHI